MSTFFKIQYTLYILLIQNSFFFYLFFQKKARVRTKVTNKNDGQTKNAAGQTKDANKPGTKPGNNKNRESEKDSTKQKVFIYKAILFRIGNECLFVN